MDNRRHQVSLGNFSLIDSQLSRMRQRFSDEMLRMDNEMDRLMSSGTERFFNNDSVLITNDGNQKAIKLTFDVSQYRPEEVSVETTDEKIIVRAKHEERSNNKNIFMEYHREMSLPAGTDPASINITISNDGVLVATVPCTGQLTSATTAAIGN
ncbi:heat shock protein 27-like [Bradysia coprophila]|uniref:heat shock protein 27-like n=1 Tax=Bradysia coprophila TaxID=38358 RepID=UPI00187DBA59|nr:heat shock protein 27-like [Bradysia coprophila]